MTDTTNHAEVIRQFIAKVMDTGYHRGPAHCESCCGRRGAALPALDALTRELDSLRAENEGFRTLEEKSCTAVYLDLRTELGLDRDQSLFDEVMELRRKANLSAAQSARIATLEAALACNMGEDYLSLQALYINQLNEAKIKDARIAMLKEALTLYMKASIAITNHATAHGWDGIMPDEFGWIKEAPARAHIALATSKGERLNVPRVIEPDIESKEARP